MSGSNLSNDQVMLLLFVVEKERSREIATVGIHSYVVDKTSFATKVRLFPTKIGRKEAGDFCSVPCVLARWG